MRCNECLVMIKHSLHYNKMFSLLTCQAAMQHLLMEVNIMSQYFDAVMDQYLKRLSGRKQKGDYWSQLKKRFYKKDFNVIMEGGLISFNPNSLKEVEGGEKLTYDQYLEVMKNSLGKVRNDFIKCYYDAFDYSFKGTIIKKNDKRVLFDRININGFYPDGTGFRAKEDHVWLDKHGFEIYDIGSHLEFNATIYRYLKTGNGKSIDFALKDPVNIRVISDYELPTSEELLEQFVNELICETCMFREHCNGFCIANQEEVDWKKQQLLQFAKTRKDE